MLIIGSACSDARHAATSQPIGSRWMKRATCDMCPSIMARLVQFLCGVVGAVGLGGCEFPRPADVMADGAAIGDAAESDAMEVDAGSADATEIDAFVPHAPYLEPRYLPDVCDVAATMPEFLVTNFGNFDTSLNNNCTGGVVAQDNGPEICVVRYGSIHVEVTGGLTVSGSRALALVADTMISIDGILDIAAKGKVSGPGGGTLLSGGQVSSDGGGGAGFASAGGAGGGATADGGGAPGGAASIDPALLTILLGGTRSVPALGSTLPPGVGGGGGAATLIACRGQVSVSGTIDAGGGGGEGGKRGLNLGPTDKFYAGAGGGSGGNVVLQGMSVVVTGQVFANGGGGGSGMIPVAGQTGTPGNPGGNGTRSTTEAAAGGIAPGAAGGGGAGGREGASPGRGVHPSATTGLPGGGGGSTGFFQTYTPAGAIPTLSPTAASPAFRTNKVVGTR